MPLIPKGLTRGLIDRIRNLVDREFSQRRPVQDEEAPPPEQQSISGIGDIHYRIRVGARDKTLLWMKYNNTWRFVEPYSFRYRSAGLQPLFYGFCRLHNTIEAYRLDRVQDLHNTDRPYSPRWDVEIA